MTGESAALVEAIIAGGSADLRVFVPLDAGLDLTERPITVDQTNRSVVVGERVVVKWMRTPGPDRSTPLLAHLAANGFRRMPTPHAALFRGDDLVALVTAFLPDGQDGWDWGVDDLLAALDGGPPADFGAELGALAAELHAALATLPAPAEDRAEDRAEDWAKVLDEALATEGDGAEWLRSIRPRLAADLARSGAGKAIHLHGDLHVGQILRWRDGYAVIDFDGNPTLAARAEPVARDVAQLRTSVLHVAEIVNRRTDGRHRAELVDWGRRTTGELLTAYTGGLAARGRADLFDPGLLHPFEVEQQCRDLVYAARFLPRWRYAPLGVLRSWYG